MGLFSDSFKELKKADMPLYRTPKSIQETIEIKKIAENGIFEVADGRYSKCYRFSDINYSTMTEKEQEDIFIRYCQFLDSMDCCFKITINNKNKDMQDLRETVLMHYKGDGFDDGRRAYNDIIEEKIMEGTQGIEQELYLTLIVTRKSFEEAKVQFATLESSVRKSYQQLGTDITPLDGNERLKVLYGFYHLGREDGFNFDIKQAKKTGSDFRNDLCNGMLKYYPDHIEDESKFVRALFFKKLPGSLPDRFLNEIVSLPVHSFTSIDVVPVPKEMAVKVLQKKYLGVESDIIRQQRVRNKNNDFSTEISYMKRNEKKKIEETMDDVRENGQCMFYVAVTIVIMAGNMEELDSITETIGKIGRSHSVNIDVHYLKQREALNTALPIGVRQVGTMRTMLTQPLAALMPFNVQELNDGGGNYYGINQESRNINIGNRKKLVNGNGFIFGVSGSGKSFFAKQEMGSVFLNTPDDVVVIDPMGEYFNIAASFKGTVVNLSPYTRNYLNPFDADIAGCSRETLRDIAAEKSVFMLSLFERLLKKGLKPYIHNPVIDKCMMDTYTWAWKNGRIPLMSDFHHRLEADSEPEARELALALRFFTEGSLNIFNHQTNVDMDSRFTVYGIQDLGTQLAPVAMLVMMEAVQKKITSNGKRGRATWLYVDECHMLLKNEYSAGYLKELWKKVRKQGGLCTGITQNITDLLYDDNSATLLSNSEFISLLRQSDTDSKKIEETTGISGAQLRYVNNSQRGMGLLKCGNIVIPFDNRISRESSLYRLYNTDLHEKIAEGSIIYGEDGAQQEESALQEDTGDAPTKIYIPKRHTSKNNYTELYNETAQAYNSPWDFEDTKGFPGSRKTPLHEDGESWMIYG